MQKIQTVLANIVRRIRFPASASKPVACRINDATLVLTHAEICNRHGTGALLMKILEGVDPLVVFYTKEYFGQNEVGTVAHHVQHEDTRRQAVRDKVANLLGTTQISRILCVPYFEDDALSALAAAEISGAPIALYIMDDQNIFAKGIADKLMGELVAKSAICFAISDPLRIAYRQKFDRDFWIIPPVASEKYFLPDKRKANPGHPPRGILIGNIWSLDILTQFRQTVGKSGLQIDWYGNAGKPFIELDPTELAKEGIHLHENLSDEPLVQALRQADYAVMPSGTLDGVDTHEWLAKASLPSRIIYVMTASNLPIIVLGHSSTAAAQFVVGLGLGAVSAYEASGFLAAVREVTDPKTSEKCRENAHRLSPAFRSEDLACWIWQSMKIGKPADSRYEEIFTRLHTSN